jgi:signal transduction histidine kinase
VADDSRLQTIVEFSRLVSDAQGPGDVLPAVLDAAVTHLRADAAAVLAVTEEGEVDVAAEHGLPPATGAFSGSLEDLEALGQELAAARGARFSHTHTLPLVSGGDLFGAVALYYARERDLDDSTFALARALVDLSAIAFRRAVQDKSLRDSYDALKASRELLARSERLRSLGQMAATVSHDLKNVLNPLGLQVELLRRRLAGDEAVREIADKIAATIRHGVGTVDRLRRFSAQGDRPRAAAPEQLDDLIARALDVCGAHSRADHEGVELRHEHGAPPPVTVEASEITDAIVNLVLNALDAVGPGARVLIRTGTENGQSWFEVCDNGPGLPDEVLERLFEPFVSTKGKQGTGLGLAMVYAAANRHGGEVRIETGADGTTFRVLLPAAT